MRPGLQSGAAPADTVSVGDLEKAAATVNAVDLFVLRAVVDGQYVNLDGVGRGKGWAGNITLEPAGEPWLDPDQAAPHRHAGELRRILGPFWSTEAVQVTVGDFVIVFGGSGVAAHDDDVLLDAAALAAWSVGEVPPEKRLADELELTQAGLAVASIDAADPESAARALADAAADLLGCEFAAVVLTDGPDRLVYGDDSWRPQAPDDDVVAAIRQLVGPASDLVVDQEVAASPVARRPLALDDGLVARCAIPLGPDSDIGWLVCGHRIEQPRGFTSLCQRVAETIGDQGGRVMDRSLRLAG